MYILCTLHCAVCVLVPFSSKCTYQLTLRHSDLSRQLPSNLFLRRLGGVHWLSFLVVAWGAVQLAMGFVPTWGVLALCRVLLGTFEVPDFVITPEVISLKRLSVPGGVFPRTRIYHHDLVSAPHCPDNDEAKFKALPLYEGTPATKSRNGLFAHF